MRKYKLVDICSKLRDCFSEVGMGITMLLVLICAIAVIALCITTGVDINNMLNCEMSISSGIIIDKYDYSGYGRYSDAYYFKYRGENSDGEVVIRTDRVTAVTYENYNIGDYYESETSKKWR